MSQTKRPKIADNRFGLQWEASLKLFVCLDKPMLEPKRAPCSFLFVWISRCWNRNEPLAATTAQVLKHFCNTQHPSNRSPLSFAAAKDAKNRQCLPAKQERFCWTLLHVLPSSTYADHTFQELSVVHTKSKSVIWVNKWICHWVATATTRLHKANYSCSPTD